MADEPEEVDELAQVDQRLDELTAYVRQRDYDHTQLAEKRADELRELRDRRERRTDEIIERRATSARVMLTLFLGAALGAFGLGIALIVEGISRNKTSFATLGVILVRVTVLASFDKPASELELREAGAAQVGASAHWKRWVSVRLKPDGGAALKVTESRVNWGTSPHWRTRVSWTRTRYVRNVPETQSG